MKKEAAGGLRFENVTAASGLDFTYRNGEESDRFTILETLGGGVALFDYDGDGRLDVFLTGGGTIGKDDALGGLPNRLFRNEGSWKFRDVTAEAGLPTEGPFYSHGAAAADYDDDGWPDLLVTGYGRLALYRNVKGKFREVTKTAGLTDPGPLHWSTSAAWGDFDGDGRLDLFVCHYVDWSFANHPRCPGYKPGRKVDVCPPERFAPMPPALYWNQGDGTFHLAQDAGLVPGKSLGVVAADLDDDGKLDLYVANDAQANFLYLNQGGRKFREEGAARGVAFNDLGHPDGSMGVDVADHDGTGRLSLFVSNYETEAHALYAATGNGRFRFASRTEGITAIGTSFVGFGTCFADFDRDGAEDLFLANGHVVRFPAHAAREQVPVLIRNLHLEGKKRFENVAAGAGEYFGGKYLGRGVAWGDLDDDGRIDLVISHTNAPAVLLRNTTPTDHHWLGVRLRGKKPHDPIGARVTLTIGDRKLLRVVKGGGSYLSTGDRRLVFGLGKATEVAELEVRWPDGARQSFSGSKLAIDRYQILEAR